MPYDKDNVFAKILRGEVPCIKVYEDAQTLAFMDIMPQADGHTLVIPKEQAETIFDLSPEGAANLMRVTQKVAQAVLTGTDADGISLLQRNGAAAGQTVAHVHFNIVPRWEDVPLREHVAHIVDKTMLEPIAEKIRSSL